ncbi:MAG: class I SAM-dependent methyltransferase [Gammaproteobacteria bacterium]
MNIPLEITRDTQNTIPLPVPSHDALEHSERLCRRIREVISDNGGNISFARYMELALYEPALGYYSSGTGKFGEPGDFVTAPVISPLFAECLARQCHELLSRLAEPVIVECGPGTGDMACVLLAALEQELCPPARYYLLEVSADLRERQQQLMDWKIPHLLPRVEWIDRLPPRDFAGIILANEVLDAIPVNRYLFADGELYDLGVGTDGKSFNWTVMPLGGERLPRMKSLLQEVMPAWPESYCFEVNHHISPWLAAVTEKLQQGMVLLIDYGYPRREYFHPQRNDGTLLCHYRHHVHHDPFFYPGLQDITSSVDFTAVAEAAVACRLEVKGYTTQAHFLLGCGLAGILEEKQLSGAIARAELGRQAQILTLPGEMGESFKVMALAKNMAGPLRGFSLADHRARL